MFVRRDSHVVNPDLAEYHVPANLDVPAMDVVLVEERGFSRTSFAGERRWGTWHLRCRGRDLQGDLSRLWRACAHFSDQPR